MKLLLFLILMPLLAFGAGSNFEFVIHPGSFAHHLPDFEKKAHFDEGGTLSDWAKIHTERSRKEYKEYLCSELKLKDSSFTLTMETINERYEVLPDDPIFKATVKDRTIRIHDGYKIICSGDSDAVTIIKKHIDSLDYAYAPDPIRFMHWRVIELNQEHALKLGVSLYEWGEKQEYIHLPCRGEAIELISKFLEEHPDSSIWYYRSPLPLLRSEQAYMTEGLVAFDKESGQYIDDFCINVYDTNYESRKTNGSNKTEVSTPLAPASLTP